MVRDKPTWHARLTMFLEKIDFEQCISDVCVFRSIEDGRVSTTAVVHVEDMFAVGLKNRCDVLCNNLNRQIRVKNLGELKEYGDCHNSKDRGRGILTIFQQFGGRVCEEILCCLCAERSTSSKC